MITAAKLLTLWLMFNAAFALAMAERGIRRRRNEARARQTGSITSSASLGKI